MNWNKNRIIGVAIVLSVAWTSMHVFAEEPQAKPTIDMPRKDRETIDQYLGKGVVGKAVPADVIGDPLEYVQSQQNATHAAHMTHGDLKGTIVDHEVKKETGPSGREQWRVSAGVSDVLVLSLNDRGELVFLSHAEPKKGLNGLYNPPPPLLVKGMKPGSTNTAEFDVKIVKMDNPNDVEHEGHLKLKLSYLGMFEITTPAGKFDAALIKSAYEGKIGPAKINDAQYRFFAKGVGVVGMVEHKDISAFLVYNDTLKVGKLLGKRK
jgi:hypothetical protein